MKKIIFLFVLALTVCACSKDSDEYSSNSIVGFWSDIAGSTSNKNSMYHFDGNNCYNYLYSSDSEAFGDLEVWCDDVYPYLYDSKTKTLSMDGVTADVEISGDVLMLKYDKLKLALKRINIPKELAPNSIEGRIIDISELSNYRFNTSSNCEVGYSWIEKNYYYSCLNNPEYTYTKKGNNSASFTVKYREYHYLLYYASYEYDLNATVEMEFMTPFLGKCKGRVVYSGEVNYKLYSERKEPYNETREFECLFIIK